MEAEPVDADEGSDAPVAAPLPLSRLKRSRPPTDGGQQPQKKGKQVAGRKPPENSKSRGSETRTSCSSQAPAESVNEICDDEDEEVQEVIAAPTRRLTSDVWQEMTKKMVHGKPKGICNYCHKELTAGAKSGTSHLRDHLKICTQRILKLRDSSGKSMCQSQLRMTAQVEGKVNVESYTFDQETCRTELANMIVLHDYPLSIVDHTGFRRFVHALQPLFKLHTRNTIRYIMSLDVMMSAIHNIRESVAYWTATPKRVEKFEEMAKYKKVKITNKLRLDCKTRWNSVFIMLETALPYRAVFERAKIVDKQYENLPTSDEWDFASMVVPRLSLFYEITTLFSGKDYVTANVFFPKICEIKMKIRQWATSDDLCIQEMSNNMTDKFDKYWTEIQGLMGIATLLDPRYKKHMLVACFAMLHGITSTSVECIEKVQSVVANLHSLIEEYELDGDGYQHVEESSTSEKTAPAIMSFFHDIVAQQKPAAARLQGEIEHYLTDDLVPYTENFDVLDWWKVAGTRYPTIRKVARDIFAIPITSVASESAFSISGRIVDEHRSRLTSKMLEVLMCQQNWLRNKYKDAHTGEQSFWSCLQDTQEEDSDLISI